MHVVFASEPNWSGAECDATSTCRWKRPPCIVPAKGWTGEREAVKKSLGNGVEVEGRQLPKYGSYSKNLVMVRNEQPGSREENEEKADAIAACGGAEDAIIGRLLMLSITHPASIPRARSFGGPSSAG